MSTETKADLGMINIVKLRDYTAINNQGKVSAKSPWAKPLRPPNGRSGYFWPLLGHVYIDKKIVRVRFIWHSGL